MSYMVLYCYRPAEADTIKVEGLRGSLLIGSDILSGRNHICVVCKIIERAQAAAGK